MLTTIDSGTIVSNRDKQDLAAAFRQAFRSHPAGIAIVSANSDNGPVALTVSSLISLSATPPTVAFSLSSTSSASPRIMRADTIVIHFVRHKDIPLAQLCATSGSERFGEGIAWARLETGEPRYTDIDTWFRARISRTFCVEDATLVVAEMLEAGGSTFPAINPGLSAVYMDRQWHGLLPPAEQATGEVK